MIEREVIEFVAAADWTDDCRVRVEMRKRRMTLTVTEATALRAELDDAIREASRAVEGLVHTPVPLISDVDHVSPDCKVGKHPTWHDTAWDDVADVEVPCECACHTEAVAA